jgi:hypothetical protein
VKFLLSTLLLVETHVNSSYRQGPRSKPLGPMKGNMTLITNRQISQRARSAKSEKGVSTWRGGASQSPVRVAPRAASRNIFRQLLQSPPFSPVQAFQSPCYRWLNVFHQPQITMRLPARGCAKLQPSPPISNSSPPLIALGSYRFERKSS